MLISSLIIIAVLLMFGPKKILYYLVVALIGYAFPVHFFFAVLAMGITYQLYRYLINRFTWLKRFF